MKKIFRKNRIVAIALLTLFTTSVALSASASETPVVPVELKYAGKVNNQPAFQLSVNGNAEHNEFLVVIRDEYGNALYWENIKAETFSKKFVLNTDELGNEKLRFEITSRKSKQTTTFEVDHNTRTVEETSVNIVKK